MSAIGDGRVKRARMAAYCAIAVFILVAFTVLVVGVLLLLPWHPMTVYSYTTEADEVCPSQVVPVYVSYEVQEGVEIDSMEVRAGWEELTGDGGPTGNTIFLTRAVIVAPDEYFDPGYHYSTTRTPRLSPPGPGLWAPTSELTVHGKHFGIPNAQVVNGTEEESGTVQVLPEEEC